MNASTQHSRGTVPGAWLLILALCAPLAQAEVYKWVDEKGRTHYGERKPGSGSASVSEVKIKPFPIVDPAAPSQQPPKHDWLRAPKPPANAPTPTAAPHKRSRTGGREDGTDASRCDLARDVLDGNLRHGNGAPIDKHDIDTAKNDIKLFCKSR